MITLDRFEKGVWIVKYEDSDLLSDPIELKLITCNPCKYKLMDKTVGESVMEFIDLLPPPDEMSDELVNSLMSNVRISDEDIDFKSLSLKYIDRFYEKVSSSTLCHLFNDDDVDEDITKSLDFNGLKIYVIKYGLRHAVYSSFPYVGDRHPVIMWTLSLMNRYIKINYEPKDTEEL